MLWQTSRLLYYVSGLIIYTFLSFFIWESENDLHSLLIFNLGFFASIPFAALISGYVSDRLDPKVAFLMGTWFQIMQLLLVLLYHDVLTTNIILAIGIVGGIGEGLSIVSMQIITRSHESDNNITHFYASRSLILSVLKLLLPLTAAFIVGSYGGYSLLFKIITVILIINSALVLFVKHDYQNNKYSMREVLSYPGTNKDKWPMVKGVFISGISEGTTETILPVIILVFVGSILNWGLLNTAFVIISILLAFFMQKYLTDVNSKLVYAIGALLFAIASVFFITEFNFYIIIIFLVAKSAMDIIKEANYNASIERIVEEDRHEYRLYAEYQVLIEFVTALGRLIPVLILIFVGINMKDHFILQIIFLTTGLLPLISLSFLGKTAIFQKDNPKEDYVLKSARREQTIPATQKSTPTLSMKPDSQSQA